MLEALTELYNFLTQGIFGFVTDLIAYLMAGIIYWKLIFMVSAVKAYMGVALWFIDFLQVSIYMQKFVNNFDSGIAGLMSYLRVFEGLVIVLSARLAVFIFRLVK